MKVLCEVGVLIGKFEQDGGQERLSEEVSLWKNDRGFVVGLSGQRVLQEECSVWQRSWQLRLEGSDSCVKALLGL